MKKIIALLFISISLIACNKEPVKKPENLLPENKMVDILYDLTLLQAINSVTPGKITDNDIDVSTYIYKKHNIDSLTFAANHKYYASKLEIYESIHKKVTERIKSNKDEINKLVTGEMQPEQKKENDSISAN